MPTYRYKARDKFGASFSGTIETTGKDAVAAQLRDSENSSGQTTTVAASTPSTQWR